MSRKITVKWQVTEVFEAVIDLDDYADELGIDSDDFESGEVISSPVGDILSAYEEDDHTVATLDREILSVKGADDD